MLYVDPFHHTQPSPMTVEVSWDSTPWDTASSIFSALEAAATCRGARAHATSDTQLGALFAALIRFPQIGSPSWPLFRSRALCFLGSAKPCSIATT